MVNEQIDTVQQTPVSGNVRTVQTSGRPHPEVRKSRRPETSYQLDTVQQTFVNSYEALLLGVKSIMARIHTTDACKQY